MFANKIQNFIRVIFESLLAPDPLLPESPRLLLSLSSKFESAQQGAYLKIKTTLFSMLLCEKGNDKTQYQTNELDCDRVPMSILPLSRHTYSQCKE